VSVWVQGTAATALAGVYGALKVQGKEAHSLDSAAHCSAGGRQRWHGSQHYDGTRHGQTRELYMPEMGSNKP